MKRSEQISPTGHNTDPEACTVHIQFSGIYSFVIIKTSQAMQNWITKYDYNYSTKDSLKDYQRHSRCRVNVLKGFPSVTVQTTLHLRHQSNLL